MSRTRGVDLLDARREQDVGAGRRGQLGVALLAARVALEVGALVELRRVDEQRHHHPVALRAGVTDQREVALVQGAHRGHQADRQLLTAGRREHRAQPSTVRTVFMRSGEVGGVGLIGFGPVPCGYRRDFRCSSGCCALLRSISSCSMAA